MESGAGSRNVQEESAAGTQKTLGFATTSGQDYEVFLCCLVFLRALRHASDFYLVNNDAQFGKFDDVVLFFRLKEDQDDKYRAILLQAKHRDTFRQKPLTAVNPFRLKEYLESFKAVRSLWERPVDVGSRFVDLQEVSLVLYTNTGCEVGEAAVDVTNCREVRHLQEILDTGGRIVRICEERRVGLPRGEETSAFLSHLILCTDQMSVDTADAVLEAELGGMLKLTSPPEEVARNLVTELKRVVRLWRGEGTVRYLTAESEEWCKVLEMEIARLNDATRTIDRQLDLHFTESALEDFDVVKRRFKQNWIRVRDEHQADAVRSRLLRVQKNSLVVGVNSLKTHLEEVEALWGSKTCPTLAVDIPTEGSPTLLQRLQEAVRSDARRHLVVIARGKPSAAADGCWRQVDAEPTWSVLQQVTRDRLMATPVRLQGGHGEALVALSDVVGENPSHDVMTDDVISSVCECEAAMNLGEAMAAPLQCYLPRCLRRTSASGINFSTLQNTKTLIFPSPYFSPNSEFTKGLNVLSISDIHTGDEIKDVTLVEGRRNEYDIRQLCSRFRVRGVSGEISSEGLRGNVTEFVPFTWMCKEKAVVIEGPPGVGKSSFVTAMCSSVKRYFPGAWVLRLDMGRHSEYIKKTDFTEVSHVKEFLLLKGLQKDPTSLERRLLEHSLGVTGNVFLFLDAFDEISPDFTRRCCDLLRGIAQVIRCRQMVVTTRPVTTKDVEEALRTAKAFTLPVFSEEEQGVFLEQFLAAKGKQVGEEEISSLRQCAGPALEIPLLCRMAAEVLLEHRRGGEQQLLLKVQEPWRKVLLYDVFVEKVVTNRLAEKLGLEASAPGIKKLLECGWKQHVEDLQALAARKQLPLDRLQHLSVSTATPEEKFGLVVVDSAGGVDFEHRTYAEYFLGRWLARHWRQLPRPLLGRGLFADGFEFVTATFNWWLFAHLPLHVAVALGDEEAIRRHLPSWTTDSGGRSPLHVAAMTSAGRRDVWELLTASAGDDLHRKDDVLGTTAVEYAVVSRNLALVVSILEGEETEVKEHATSLCEVVLDAKKDFANSLDQRGSSLLHLAAAANFTRAMAILIKIRHEVDLRDKLDCTPLHKASEFGHMAAVRLLTDAGADVDVVDVCGYTPLTWAAREGHQEVVKGLVQRGADFGVKSTLGNTPLALAAYEGHLEVVKILLDNGADLNGKNDAGDTALTDAAREGHLEVVKVLVEKGAQLNTRNNVGETALTVAAREGHMEVVKVLVEKGADFNM